MPVEINYISIRNFADNAKDWAKYLLSKKKHILIAALIGGILGLTIFFFTKPTYKGELTFVLTTENTPRSGLVAFANQFGLNFGNKNDAFIGENIIQLFRSKKMIQRALFQTIPNNGELIINQIGKTDHFFSKWEKKSSLASLIPFTANDTNAISVKDSLIKEIYYHVLTHNFSIVRIEKELNFYKLTVTSTDEYVSNFLPIALVKVTADFYSEIKSSIAYRNLKMLNHEADSLKNILDKRLQSSLAATEPTFNLNTAQQSAQATSKKLQIQANVLQQVYQTVLQNLAAAKITLQKVTPVYQVVDEPKLSLLAYKPGSVTFISAGIFFITFFYIFFLLIIKTLKDSY